MDDNVPPAHTPHIPRVNVPVIHLPRSPRIIVPPPMLFPNFEKQFERVFGTTRVIYKKHRHINEATLLNI